VYTALWVVTLSVLVAVILVREALAT
jgi:hypothetical protein